MTPLPYPMKLVPRLLPKDWGGRRIETRENPRLADPTNAGTAVVFNEQSRALDPYRRRCTGSTRDSCGWTDLTG